MCMGQPYKSIVNIWDIKQYSTDREEDGEQVNFYHR